MCACATGIFVYLTFLCLFYARSTPVCLYAPPCVPECTPRFNPHHHGCANKPKIRKLDWLLTFIPGLQLMPMFRRRQVEICGAVTLVANLRFLFFAARRFNFYLPRKCSKKVVPK